MSARTKLPIAIKGPGKAFFLATIPLEWGCRWAHYNGVDHAQVHCHGPQALKPQFTSIEDE